MTELVEEFPLRQVTTMGVGGNAKYFTTVHTIDEMQSVLKLCREKSLSFLILGKGSNLLFDDQGYNGVVILNKIDFLKETSPGTFFVGAGMSFSRLGTITARKGFSGLEFAAGIPGSVGGAIFMNAGACGQETKDSLLSCEFIDSTGNITTYQRSDHHFSYRRSPFQKMKGAIVSATFQLTPSKTAKEEQKELIAYRTKTQPYNAKSAGCMFQNPEGHSAGQLIEIAGLKGLSHGDATISDRHGNFIINKGSAKTSDILSLVEDVKKRVKEKTAIDLKEEVRYIPYE